MRSQPTGTGQAAVADTACDDDTRRVLHRTIAGVRADADGLRFNTAIAKLTELTNHLTKAYADAPTPREVAEPLVLMLAPFAPHIAEELWSRLGHPDTLAYEPFPVADEQWVRADTVTLVVQVNGKVRDRVEVPVDISEDDAIAAARASARIVEVLAGAEPRRVIARPPKLVNIVV